MNERESVLVEADRVVNGDRQEAYGDPDKLYEMIAGVMCALGIPMSARDAIVFNQVQKICRQRVRPKRDNLVDLSGYAEIQARVEGL